MHYSIMIGLFLGAIASRKTLPSGAMQLTPWTKILMAWCALYLLATFIPSLAITTRRLHDLGRPGWEQYLSYRIYHIMWWQEGQVGANNYGAGPE